MKKVNKVLCLALGFGAGLLAGMFIRLSFEIINGRPVAIGGEALILPLIVLLVCFGFVLGKEVRIQRRYDRTFRRGRHEGYAQGYVDGVGSMVREYEAEIFRREETGEPTPEEIRTIASGQ